MSSYVRTATLRLLTSFLRPYQTRSASLGISGSTTIHPAYTTRYPISDRNLAAVLPRKGRTSSCSSSSYGRERRHRSKFGSTRGTRSEHGHRLLVNRAGRSRMGSDHDAVRRLRPGHRAKRRWRGKESAGQKGRKEGQTGKETSCRVSHVSLEKRPVCKLQN